MLKKYCLVEHKKEISKLRCRICEFIGILPTSIKKAAPNRRQRDDDNNNNNNNNNNNDVDDDDNLSKRELHQRKLRTLPPHLYNAENIEKYEINKKYEFTDSNAATYMKHFIRHKEFVEYNETTREYEFKIGACNTFLDLFNPNGKEAVQQMDAFCYQASRLRLALDFVAATKLAFASIERPEVKSFFAAAKAPEMNRRSLRKKMFDRVDTLMHEVFTKLNGQFIHLTSDAGTKIRRYLLVVVHSPLCKPIILDVRDEKHLIGGYSFAENDNEQYRDDNNNNNNNNNNSPQVLVQHSAANLSQAFDNITNHLLEKYNVCVASMVTDNCAAFSGAVEQANGLLHGRCTCHGINLIIRMLSSFYAPWKEATTIALDFIKNATEKKIMGPAKLNRFIDTRWSSLFDVIHSVIEAHLKPDRMAVITQAGLQPLPIRGTVSKLEKVRDQLDNYMKAIRIAECDDANQLDVLLALGKMGFTEKDYGLEKQHFKVKEGGDVLFDIGGKMDSKIEDRIITPALVIVSYFSYSWNADDLDEEDLEELRKQIKFWLTKTGWSRRIINFLQKQHASGNQATRYSVSLLEVELEGLDVKETSHLSATNQYSLNEDNWGKVIEWMEKDLGFVVLPALLKVIKNVPASEASSERGFSIIDRIVTNLRHSLAPETVSMLTKYSSLSNAMSSEGKFADADCGFKKKEVFAFPLGEDGKPIRDPAADSLLTAEATSSVIDLAVEKLKVVLEKREKSSASKKKNCCGPPVAQQRSSCTRYEVLRSDRYYLILCVGCKVTRCNSCWGINADEKKFKEMFPRDWRCSKCQSATQCDDWFTTRVEKKLIRKKQDEESDEEIYEDDEYDIHGDDE